jgi:magnesium-transporting ATPase (P-type)
MPCDEKFTKKYAVDATAREGLTTESAEAYQAEKGYNELPVIEVKWYWILLAQFMGTMPYMLEVAFFIALAVGDYADVGILGAMLLANGFLGYKEELECLEALVRILGVTLCYEMFANLVCVVDPLLFRLILIVPLFP